jgi:hypothetical protein
VPNKAETMPEVFHPARHGRDASHEDTRDLKRNGSGCALYWRRLCRVDSLPASGLYDVVS